MIPAVVPPLVLAAAAEGQQLVQQLIGGARKEGELDVMITSSQGEKGAKELTDAFQQRFRLNIKVNADLSGQESQKFNQAIAEIKAGVPPTFDLMQGEPPSVPDIVSPGGVEPIKNWEALLAEVAPEAYKFKDKVSPAGVAGYAFLWATRITALVYNPKPISEQELPKPGARWDSPSLRRHFRWRPG